MLMLKMCSMDFIVLRYLLNSKNKNKNVNYAFKEPRRHLYPQITR